MQSAAVAGISYPSDLPVSQRKDDILAAVRDHQVVVVAGETGSGKTTQLPKICLELGRGVGGVIGHTQPRRLATRTVAARIAEELGAPLGGAVGYKVRFSDRTGAGTRIKVMTDGILLAEIQSDRQLHRYDTLIIDEAHERSLNIDFILGYLKQLLPRRPDLKIVITSATVDPERFSRHFDDAPVIEVSGRMYPVEVRYRPTAEDDQDRDEIAAICSAVDELRAEAAGDILVFLSGEREIRDTADVLRKSRLTDTEVLPLYARLSGLCGWTIGALPRRVVRGRSDGYPALVDEGESVAVRVLGTEAEQGQAMWRGTRRLLLLSVPSPVKAVYGRLPNDVKLALTHHPHGSVAALFDDCVACAIDAIVAGNGGPAWDAEGFQRLLGGVRAQLGDATFGVVTAVGRILAATHDVRAVVQELRRGSRSPAVALALADVEAQLAGLVFPGFVTATGSRRLPDVLRYLRAIERRLKRLPENVGRDRELMAGVHNVQEAYRALLEQLSAGMPAPQEWREIRWMIEELRVSYFAQPMRTALPVSEKRILRAIDELGGH
jgi:hypothetical protein